MSNRSIGIQSWMGTKLVADFILGLIRVRAALILVLFSRVASKQRDLTPYSYLT